MKVMGLDIALNAQAPPLVPQWVHLVPAGEFRGRDGRGPWKLADPEAFIAATVAHQAGADLPLDYEHQSALAEQNGRPAPAAGWIKELQARPDGIYGRVEWTAVARRMVAAKEYRYISPVFYSDRATGELLRLDSAALVAQPNLQLKSLNNAGAGQPPSAGGQRMEEFLRQLAALLGLAEGASQEEIYAAVEQLKTAGAAEAANDEGAGPAAEGDPADLAEAEADLMDAVAALVATAEGPLAQGEAAPAPNKALRTAGMTKLSNSPRPTRPPQGALGEAFKAMNLMGARLAALEGFVARNRAEKAVGAALSAGKITPALKTWALNYAGRDPEGFAGFIKTAPVVVAPGAAAADQWSFNSAALTTTGSGLGAEEKAVCKQLGLSEAEYLKARGKEFNHD